MDRSLSCQTTGDGPEKSNGMAGKSASEIRAGPRLSISGIRMLSLASMVIFALRFNGRGVVGHRLAVEVNRGDSGVLGVELEYVLLLELGFFFLPIDLDRDLDFLVD